MYGIVTWKSRSSKVRKFLPVKTPLSFSWQGQPLLAEVPRKSALGRNMTWFVWVYHMKNHFSIIPPWNFTGIRIEHLENWKLSARNCDLI